MKTLSPAACRFVFDAFAAEPSELAIDGPYVTLRRTVAGLSATIGLGTVEEVEQQARDVETRLRIAAAASRLRVQHGHPPVKSPSHVVALRFCR